MIPDDAREDNDKPVQRAEKKALDRVSIFMHTEAAALARALRTNKKEDAQRQPSAIPRQIGHKTIAEGFMAEVRTAEKRQQANRIDRQAPGKLQEIEQSSGPACCGNRYAASAREPTVHHALTQWKDRSTARCQPSSFPSLSDAGMDGRKVRSTAQLCRTSSCPDQKPTANPAR